jgi:hypothetical protein
MGRSLLDGLGGRGPSDGLLDPDSLTGGLTLLRGVLSSVAVSDGASAEALPAWAGRLRPDWLHAE